MDLVLKLPKGKLPFIGILFEHESVGGRMYSEIIERYPFKEYRVVIENIGNTINLRLICEETTTVYFYNHLGFDAEKLRSWLYLTKHQKEFNFGHVFNQIDKHQIVKSSPSLKKFFIKVVGCSFITTEEPDADLPFVTRNNRSW